MKRILNSILLLGAMTMGLFSCAQDDDVANSTAQPVIKYTRAIESEKADSLIVGASMGQTIAIIGEGLEGVSKVKFNDQYAMLNPVYVTSESIVCTVPAVMPGVVDNLLTVTTQAGKSCTIDFAVGIPTPTITSASCEWTEDGATTTLYGKSFYAREDGTIDVIFPGNMPAVVNYFDDNQINVTVPEGTQGGLISVINDYGRGNSQFIFRNTDGIFVNGENPTAWNGWSLSDFSDVNPLDGAYISFKGATGSWAWPNATIQFFYINPTASPLVSDGEPADYALRFEVRSYEWHHTPMVIWFNSSTEHNVDSEDAQYHWRPFRDTKDSNYVTDGWETITLPLSDFIYNKDEKNITIDGKPRSIGSINELVNLHIMFFGEVKDEKATEFGLNLNIDNIRLVKIN